MPTVNTGFKTTQINESTRATEKGTRIAKPGQEMDKNAFLRILTAELSNQDPDNAKDSTAYVAQMAQFAGLEQMTNLNNNLNFTGAASLIGKPVSLNVNNSMGEQYVGTVKGVYKSSSGIQVGVEVVENGEKTIKDFPYDMIDCVLDGQTSNGSSAETLPEEVTPADEEKSNA